MSHAQTSSAPHQSTPDCQDSCKCKLCKCAHADEDWGVGCLGTRTFGGCGFALHVQKSCYALQTGNHERDVPTRSLKNGRKTRETSTGCGTV